MRYIIKCVSCEEVINSDDISPWKASRCSCGDCAIRICYDMGDISITPSGTFSVIEED